MMSQRRKLTAVVALCAAFGIAMTACGGSSSTAVADPEEVIDPASVTVDSVADSATSTLPTTEAAPTTEAVPTTEAPPEVERASGPADETAADGGRSCIEGDWTISEEQLDGYYSELGAVSGVPMSTTGTTRIRFIDLQFVYDAVFDLTMDLDGQTAAAKSDGVATGSYVIEDGVITTQLGANSISIVVNVAGFEIDAGDLGNDLLTSFPINDAPFNCDGPTIFFDTGDAAPHPVTLTPYQG